MDLERTGEVAQNGDPSPGLAGTVALVVVVVPVRDLLITLDLLMETTGVGRAIRGRNVPVMMTLGVWTVSGVDVAIVAMCLVIWIVLGGKAVVVCGVVVTIRWTIPVSASVTKQIVMVPYRIHF